MNEVKETADTPLAAAAYFYLLKDGSAAALESLRAHFLADYEPMAPVAEPELWLDHPQSTHFYLAKPDGTERLDIHTGTFANIYSISVLRFAPPSPADATAAAAWVSAGEAAIAAGQVDVLGSAVLIAGGDASLIVSQLKELTGPAGVDIAGSLDGRLIHQLVLPGNRQYFWLEGDSGTSEHDFISKDLPHIAWLTQRLRREWEFFKDRITTISAEKKKIDNELSRMLHQKVSGAITADSAQLLEEQINRLSSMYSALATDLHLVKETVATMEKDVVTLSRQAVRFEGNGDRAFPEYHVAEFRERLKDLLKHESDLRQSLENTKAAIDIAQTQTALLRGSQGLAVQEQTRELLNQNLILADERVSLQTAAQVIELIVVFYYTLKSWETVAPLHLVEELSSITKFGVVAVFSASAVGLSHFIGNSLHRRRIMWPQILVTAALVLLSLGAMAVLPTLKR